MPQSPIHGNLNPVNALDASSSLGNEASSHGPTSAFSSLMQKDNHTQPSNSLASPISLGHSGVKLPTGPPNSQTLLAQMQTMQETMMGMQGQLSLPNVKLTTAQKHLLKNKFVSASDNIQAAQNKMGAVGEDPGQQGKNKNHLPNEEEEEESSTKAGPIARFLNYVASGMNQLEEAKQQIASLKDKGQDLTAPDFLFIQIKLSQAQQELEFSSVLLSKAVEGFKSIMNMQL